MWRQTADNTSALSHVFPLVAGVQRFVPSIIFHFCLLSWFKQRLSAYSSTATSYPFFPPPFSFPLPLTCFFFTLFWLLMLLTGAQISTEKKGQKSQRGWRYRVSGGGTPIFSLPSIYGHSAKEGKMYGGDWKRGRVDGGGVHHLISMGGRFPPSRSGFKFIYFPGSYNEILPSTLLWWWARSAPINLSCHLVACDEPFIMPPSRTRRGICTIVLFYVMIAISLCHITQMRKLRIKPCSAEQV